MAGLLDGVIMVVESDKVQRDQTRQALQLLRSSNANVIGAVFNKRKKDLPLWLGVEFRRVSIAADASQP